MNRTALGYDLARDGAAINPVDPVNRFHPLAANRSSWWAMLPGQDGGPTLYDAMGTAPMTLSGLAAGEGWAASPRPGSLGHEIVLNGTGCAYAQIPVPGLSFSIACWIRTTNVSAAILGFNFGSDGQSPTADRALFLTGGLPRFYLYSGGTQYVTGSVSIADGADHHVRGAVDTAGVMRLYVDGLSVGTPLTVGVGANYASYLVAGHFTGSGNFTGAISDITHDTGWPAGAASDALALLSYQSGRSGHPGALNRIAPLVAASAPPPGTPPFFTDSLLSGGFANMVGF